jgi:leucine dehydrogenase
MAIHILDAMGREGFEQVIAIHDRRSNLNAFLGIHDTSRGPAFGGIRRWGYLDEDQAVRDCLRLSRSMTWKCALAGVPAGGAKLVVLDRADLDLEAAYRHIGELVDGLGGRFYTGPDVGTGPRELAWVASRTTYVTRPDESGPGELAASTCAGVIAGIDAALGQLDGRPDWGSQTIVVQGLGEVGTGVARIALERGAKVIAAEIDGERAQHVADELAIELIDPASELDAACDVFCPCALGGILHDLSIERLRCRIIAGGANNVLASPLHGDRLHERGILYVPDFVINSGALIRGATFHLTGVREPVDRIGSRIGEMAGRILDLALRGGEPTEQVAIREAQSILAAARGAPAEAPAETPSETPSETNGGPDRAKQPH